MKIGRRYPNYCDGFLKLSIIIQLLRPICLSIGFPPYSGVRLQFRHRGIGKHRERRGFPDYVKEEVLRKQNHRCAHCNRILNVVDWDHKDGNRSNNNESNCQALCPNCHAVKTRTGRK
jgi:5-methylcytosine-specific restriction endonuclease McrA